MTFHGDSKFDNLKKSKTAMKRLKGKVRFRNMLDMYCKLSLLPSDFFNISSNFTDTYSIPVLSLLRGLCFLAYMNTVIDNQRDSQKDRRVNYE